MATFLATLFVIVCVLLIIMVLLQKGRGGGLSGAFGGMGSSAFGTRTGDVFTWVTIILTAVFLLLAIITTIVYRPEPSTVSTPTFSPKPKAISKPMRVAIQCQTSKATVYYSLDGSEPTRESLEYDGTTVPVRPGVVLKARAFLSGWKDSKTAVGDYPHPSKVPPATTSAPAATRPAP